MSIVDEVVAWLENSAVPGQRTWAAYLRDCRLGESVGVSMKFRDAPDAVLLMAPAKATHVLWPGLSREWPRFPGVLLLNVPTCPTAKGFLCAEAVQFCRETFVFGESWSNTSLDFSGVVKILWRSVDDLCSKLPPDLKYWGTARDAWMRAVATAPALLYS